MATMISLAELGARLGVDTSTLRHQIRNGRLAATKFAGNWAVTEKEAARYAAASVGRPGPKPKPVRARKAKAVAP